MSIQRKLLARTVPPGQTDCHINCRQTDEIHHCHKEGSPRSKPQHAPGNEDTKCQVNQIRPIANIRLQSRQETTTTLKWIALNLHMGSCTYLSNCLVQQRAEAEKNR